MVSILSCIQEVGCHEELEGDFRGHWELRNILCGPELIVSEDKHASDLLDKWSY